MGKSNVIVARKGDQFTYQRNSKSAPEDFSLDNILAGVANLVKNHTEVSGALYFLQSVLHATAGHEFDESQTHGMAALCGLMSSAMDRDAEEYADEIAIIKELASVGVANA